MAQIGERLRRGTAEPLELPAPVRREEQSPKTPDVQPEREPEAIPA